MLFTLKEKGFTVVSSESGWASPFPSVLRGVTVVGGVPSDFYAEVDDGEVFLRAVDPIGGVYEHDAMVFRMASRIGEVPVTHRSREAGSSSYTFAKLMKLWVSHLTSLSVLPLKIAMVGSFGVSALGFVLGAVMMARALAAGSAPAGWLSLFCAVTFLFGVLFAFLGIVSAYLGRMYVSLNERGMVWIRSGGNARAEDPRRLP